VLKLIQIIKTPAHLVAIQGLVSIKAWMPAANAQNISGLVLPANSGAIGGQDKAAEMQRICRPKGMAASNRREALTFVIAHFFMGSCCWPPDWRHVFVESRP